MYFFLADKLGAILTYLDRFLRFVFHNVPGNILRGKDLQRDVAAQIYL